MCMVHDVVHTYNIYVLCTFVPHDIHHDIHTYMWYIQYIRIIHTCVPSTYIHDMYCTVAMHTVDPKKGNCRKIVIIYDICSMHRTMLVSILQQYVTLLVPKVVCMYVSPVVCTHTYIMCIKYSSHTYMYMYVATYICTCKMYVT